MKIKNVLHVAVVFGLLTSLRADEDSVLDKYGQGFSTTDSLSFWRVCQDFERDVPRAQRLGLLVKLMTVDPKTQQQAYATSGVLSYCTGHNASVDWTPELERAVYRLAESPRAELRMRFIDFLVAHKSGRDAALIQRFLTDSDDDVRDNALYKLLQQPDAKEIYRKYLRDNAGREDVRSYKTARQFLDHPPTK